MRISIRGEQDQGEFHLWKARGRGIQGEDDVPVSTEGTGERGASTTGVG